MAWLLGTTLPTCGGYGDHSEQEDGSPTKSGSKTVPSKPSQWLPSLPGATYAPFQIAEDLLDTVRWTGLFGQHTKSKAEAAKALQELRMRAAENGQEWKASAQQLDMLEGNDFWRLEDEEDEDYDVALLRNRLRALKQAINNRDMEAMLYHIRNHLKRDLGGMCNPELYRHCRVGTKFLIDEYTTVVSYTIEQLIDYCENDPTADVKRYNETLKLARTSFGKTALMLSGGGTLGMCHIGVVKALIEEGLLPSIVCGASAGSIVGSVLCTHKRDVILAKLDELQKGDLKVFQSDDEMPGWIGATVNILKGEPAFNVGNLCRVMRNLLGDITFKEAYNLTRMILNIHVSCKDKHNVPRLLNYISAPNVVIWSAVASSCAVPYVFEAPGLKCKNAATGEIELWGHLDHKYIDGSIQADLPSATLERMFNVNNFIACQVNPHVQHFLQSEQVSNSTLLQNVLSVSKSNFIFALDNFMESIWDPFLLKMLHAVITQKYDGDITILPEISWVGILKILANPTHEFMEQATRHGERATWPKIDRIRNTVAIELDLERAVNSTTAASIMKCQNRGKRHKRASSTRSEFGLSRTRSQIGSFEDAIAVPRLVRGRSKLSHNPIRSMIEGSTLSPFQLASLNACDTVLSSSDEKCSGHSSPTTSYEDEDFDDVANRGVAERPVGGGLDIRDADRRLTAFLSQPVSPSMSYKNFFATESPSRPTSPDLRRAFNGLHMSSIGSPTPSPERKRSQRKSTLAPKGP